MSTLAPEPQPVEIELQLDRILASKIFRSAQRSRAFLRYVVERTLAGSIPKEYEIAVDILGRGSDYDPSVDAAVRVEAGRLRSRLREYYTTDGMNDPVHIEIRKGGYAAVFSPRESREQVPAVQKYVSDSATVAHTETAKNGVAQPITEVPIAKPSEVRHGHKTRWLVTTAFVVMVIAVAAWQMQKRSVAAMPIRSLAVIPLENLSGDPSQDYFADGMTDELITELARLPSLRVVSRTSVMQDKDTHKPLQQIARELDVDAIVEGSIVRSGDKVRITAQLIDARNDRHLWAQSFEGRVSDILSLQDSVARDIAAQAKVALMPGAQFESGVIKSIDPAAHDAYMRGRFFLNKREAEKSTAYFREALTIDPKYAAAYAGLASALESESTLEMVKPEDAMPKATEAARRALELDPKSGEAYTALGSIETIYEWNWEAAEQDLKRGIEFSPNDSLGEMHYSAFLDAMNRPEEAVTHMRRALVLDPLSFFMTRHLGSALFLARHYDEALFYLRRAEEMEPNHFGVVENWISWIYEKKGMQSEAVNHDLATLRGTAVDADRDKLLAIFEHSGWKAYWRARIAEDSFSSQSCAPYFVGASYLRLGERDRAFEWLNRAVDRKCLWVMWAKVDPLLDDARTDARYRALLNRVHLSE